MSTNSTHQTCNHPGRDISIVGLCSAVISLGTAVTTMALSASPLVTLTSSGGAFVAIAGLGVSILNHMKHSM
ncbi:hypothetical protein ACFZCV_27850 [Streptomyces sp. NPDC007920]|uniref:hypothetical protein n=1 Tax=Streptomyces sp. NPDC007920 TaxID=3364794 RepID=UPI0036ECCA30